jgi:hypothetical protein
MARCPDLVSRIAVGVVGAGGAKRGTVPSISYDLLYLVTRFRM